MAIRAGGSRGIRDASPRPIRYQDEARKESLSSNVINKTWNIAKVVFSFIYQETRIIIKDFVHSITRDRYDVFDYIGEGASSKIHKACVNGNRDNIVAVKVSTPPPSDMFGGFHEERMRNYHEVSREAKILELLQGCPHIIKFLDSYSTSEGNMLSYAIAMELLNTDKVIRKSFSTDTSLTSNKTMSINDADIFAKQFLEALTYMEEKRVLHLDIDPSNVCWNEEKKKLTLFDFSAGKILKGDEHTISAKDYIAGTPDLKYRAPEKILGMPVRVFK